CMQQYPIYSNSRQVAGAPLSGAIFKCQLQNVADAIANNSYGAVDMSTVKADLERIFPAGVCDFSKPDLAFGATQLRLADRQETTTAISGR
ncbi:MAG: DUF6351 family protein, partial [Pseudomonadales bacterium]